VIYRLADPMLFTYLKYGNGTAEEKEPQGPALEWLVRDALDGPFRRELGIPASFECFHGTCSACEVDGLYFEDNSNEVHLISIKRSATKQAVQTVFFQPLLQLSVSTKVLAKKSIINLVSVSAFGDIPSAQLDHSMHLGIACKTLSALTKGLAAKYEKAASELLACEFKQRKIDVRTFVTKFLNANRVPLCRFVGGSPI